jgi:hypothetical protein
MIFVWISIVQMSIGMWHYHTLQYAVKMAASYATVHGASCANAGNSCQVHLSDVATILKTNAIGIPASEIQVTWTACQDSTCGTTDSQTCWLDHCISDSTYTAMIWPPSGYNNPGTSEIKIRADYLFKSALCMVAPGPGAGPVRFGQFHLPGYTHQIMLF